MGKFGKTDYWLWGLTALYTGIIYSTIHVVSKWRKFLTEKYGYEIFDFIYWIFGAIGLSLIIYIYKKNRGSNLLKPYLSLILISLIYAYYLYNLKYAVERLHFLQYGLLGALLFISFHRHLKSMPSAICALCVTYWLGLGDEFIQHLLSSRVGELKDGIINAISGALGIALVITVFPDLEKRTEPSTNQASKSDMNLAPESPIVVKSPSKSTTETTSNINSLPLYLLIVTALLNALFVIEVHGFGYRHMHLEAGIMYSSLSSKELKEYNSGKLLSPANNKVYEDEANRHLLQREYYCSNDFMNKKGKYYRRWDKCFMENQILKVHYSQFLKTKAREDVYAPIARYDKELAIKVKGNPIKWTWETATSMKWAKPKDKIFTSRVKSIIITRFNGKDLWFYTVLFIFLIVGIRYKVID